MIWTNASAHVRLRIPHHHQSASIRVPDIGLATWYGTGRYKNKNGFHRFTSNGERFDPRAMTCAHFSMPFNTVLKVTDLKTGKFIYVRVNDRMVAKPPRVIDLTLAAANALGIKDQGKAKVSLTPVELAEAQAK